MCHIFFMSAAMDWGWGFRVHCVIFHHASILFSSPVELVSVSRSIASSCAFVFTRASRHGKHGEPFRNSNKRTEEEGRMSRSRRKGKLITTKQMAPQFTVAPQGPGGTTLCTSRLPALPRGAGCLNTTLCVHFCVLTCKQKANLRHLWQGATLCSISPEFML